MLFSIVSRETRLRGTSKFIPRSLEAADSNKGSHIPEEIRLLTIDTRPG
jgi:hypothetical protein